MGIVLPDAILGAPGLLYVRYWIIKYCRIVASIDLHPDTSSLAMEPKPQF